MRLLPREEKFYHLFARQVEIISEAARLLLEGVSSGNSRLTRAAEANAIRANCRGDAIIEAKLSPTRQRLTFLDARTGEDLPVDVDWRADRMTIQHRMFMSRE